MGRLVRMRFTLTLTSAAVMSLSVLALAQGPSFAGTYALQNATNAERLRDAGIEAAIEDMGIGRGIARRRLSATTPVPRRIVVEEQGDRLHIVIAGAYELTARPNGSAFTMEDAFDYEHTARLYRRENTLVITLRGNGDVRIELRFSEDRSRVTYVMRIRSEHLPADVRYQATYRRR